MTAVIPEQDLALVIVDADGRIIDANGRASALFEAQTLIGSPVEDFIPAYDPDARPSPMPVGPATARTAAGTEVPVLATAIPFGDRTAWAIVDLRDPDRVRESFAPNASLPSHLVDLLDVGIVVQVGGEIVSANAAAARTLGLTLDALLGRTSVDPRWRAVREDGSPFPGETHPAMVALRTGERALAVMGVHTPGGDLRWIDVVAKPLVLHDGRVVATFTHFVDITAQRQADADRNAALVRFEALLADASDAVLMVEPSGTISYTGPSTGHALARPAAGLEGSSLLALASAEDRPELAHVLEQCAAKPAARTATTVGIDTPAGGRRWFEVRIRNALDVIEVGALIVTLTDVHERVAAVERLRSVNEELQQRIAERDEEHRVDRELATATELLGHCEYDVETQGVVWTAATAIFREGPVSLLRVPVDGSRLVVVETTAQERPDIAPDECWAMRTHHVHESRPPDGLTCRHLPDTAEPTICVPLGLATRPYGLLVIGADGTHLAQAVAFAERLGPFLGRAGDSVE